MRKLLLIFMMGILIQGCQRPYCDKTIPPKYKLLYNKTTDTYVVKDVETGYYLYFCDDDILYHPENWGEVKFEGATKFYDSCAAKKAIIQYLNYNSLNENDYK